MAKKDAGGRPGQDTPAAPPGPPVTQPPPAQSGAGKGKKKRKR